MPDQRVLVHPLRALAALALAALAACAAPVDVARRAGDVPPRATVPGVTLIEQEAFHCGPAALAMVMQWQGLDVTQGAIAARSFTPEARGTYLADMLGAARRQGRLAVPVRGWDGLMGEVAAGNPVIVFQNLSLPVAPLWHYAVVTGYDLEAGEVTLHSGRLARTVMDLGTFARTWERGESWALAVLPPDRLPATATEGEVLRAAAALEAAGRPGAAARAYTAGAGRWPGGWLWWFGVGNARYAAGDPAGAAAAFRRARDLAPEIPEIRQNLAAVEAAA